mmetsp:Transcript_26704/g.67299  ORF Transcript_26704/g.67299 Transcript_26704/m.67299 type:complete len:231 (+) Transcript_26704:9756-10448(+)
MHGADHLRIRRRGGRNARSRRAPARRRGERHEPAPVCARPRQRVLRGRQVVPARSLDSRCRELHPRSRAGLHRRLAVRPVQTDLRCVRRLPAQLRGGWGSGIKRWPPAPLVLVFADANPPLVRPVKRDHAVRILGSMNVRRVIVLVFQNVAAVLLHRAEVVNNARLVVVVEHAVDLGLHGPHVDVPRRVTAVAGDANAEPTAHKKLQPGRRRVLRAELQPPVLLVVLPPG